MRSGAVSFSAALRSVKRFVPAAVCSPGIPAATHLMLRFGILSSLVSRSLRIASISPITVRISVLPKGAPDADLNRDGGLVPLTEQRRPVAGAAAMKMGALSVTVTQAPLRVRVADAGGRTVQEIAIDDAGVLEFLVGDAPLLAFGEG